MDYEIEFHPVGEASRAGDAISIRYGLNGEYRVIVIDGGTDQSGDTLVEHISSFYGADTIIEHVISTHPDTDHACGLRKVLKAFTVRNLWLHGVWHHAEELLPYMADKRWTAGGLANQIKSQYPVIEELIDLASAQGTPVYEPFQGAQIGPFTVLSPSRWNYLRLVAQFRKTPSCDNDALQAENMLLGVKATGLGGIFGKIADQLRAWVEEEWNIETLREGSVTAAENESSTVLYGNFGTDRVLLTADTGANGIWWSCAHAEKTGIDLETINVIQVPHHGSRSNVTPSALNKLLGPILPAGTPAKRIAIVSAPKDDASHPRKIVMNAFHRRGAPVFPTQGNYVRKHSGTMPVRPGEGPITPMELFSHVEAYD